MADISQEQAAQSLGLINQGLNAFSEGTKLKLKAAQKQKEHLQQERNTFLTQAGNKAFPKRIRMQFYNNAAGISKSLGDSTFPAIAEFDDQVGDVLDAFGVIDSDDSLTPPRKCK